MQRRSVEEVAHQSVVAAAAAIAVAEGVVGVVVESPTVMLQMRRTRVAGALLLLDLSLPWVVYGMIFPSQSSYWRCMSLSSAPSGFLGPLPLEGEGHFRFLLHRVGARQGCWEVLARIVVSHEGGEV